MVAIGTIRKHSWIAVALVGFAIVCFIIGDLTKNNSKSPEMVSCHHERLVNLLYTSLSSTLLF